MQYLTRLLKPIHRREGIYLEKDGHNLFLMRGQTRYAIFSAQGVEIEEIHKAADVLMRVK